MAVFGRTGILPWSIDSIKCKPLNLILESANLAEQNYPALCASRYEVLLHVVDLVFQCYHLGLRIRIDETSMQRKTYDRSSKHYS